MSNCKLCGKEIPHSDFDFLFAEPETLCSECKKEKQCKDKEMAETEAKKHPDWYGPANQDEPF